MVKLDNAMNVIMGDKLKWVIAVVLIIGLVFLYLLVEKVSKIFYGIAKVLMYVLREILLSFFLIDNSFKNRCFSVAMWVALSLAIFTSYNNKFFYTDENRFEDNCKDNLIRSKDIYMLLNDIMDKNISLITDTLNNEVTILDNLNEIGKESYLGISEWEGLVFNIAYVNTLMKNVRDSINRYKNDTITKYKYILNQYGRSLVAAEQYIVEGNASFAMVSMDTNHDSISEMINSIKAKNNLIYTDLYKIKEHISGFVDKYESLWIRTNVMKNEMLDEINADNKGSIFMRFANTILSAFKSSDKKREKEMILIKEIESILEKSKRSMIPIETMLSEFEDDEKSLVEISAKNILLSSYMTRARRSIANARGEYMNNDNERSLVKSIGENDVVKGALNYINKVIDDGSKLVNNI